MPNHFHLLLQQIPPNAFSAFIQCVIITYTKYYNKKYSRVGHVFQGVFKARLIEDSADLLSTSRYIHNNAKDVSTDWINYPYSSAQHYTNPNLVTPPWLDTYQIHTLLEKGFGVSKNLTHSVYESYLKM